jgi:Xaa-Pro dipeptidase
MDFSRTYPAHLRLLEEAYAELLSASGYDAVVIHSGVPKPRTRFDDQFWPLRVTPHFQHWLPLAEADCALVVQPGARPRLIWTRPTDFWEKPPVPPGDHWQSSFEIVEVTKPEDVRAHLPQGKVAFLGESATRAASWGFSKEDSAPTRLVHGLDLLRARKTDYEVACLAEANRLAAIGHRALAEAFGSGDASELELHLAFLRATGQDDSETPYKNIVALGENAATLHHISYGKVPARGTSGQSLLVDAGASYYGYCSDVTRTHVKGSGAAASAFAGLIASVEALQQQLCAAVEVGENYEALHDRAHFEVAAALKAAGVTRGSVEETVSSGITRTFFPHGLGHSLGLQCHDVGCAQVKPRADNPFLRNTSVIAEGQCFTIEPGIYFIGSLMRPLREGPHAGAIDWAAVRALEPFGGIRIEDDLVVTGGSEVTRNLTREHLS